MLFALAKGIFDMEGMGMETMALLNTELEQLGEIVIDSQRKNELKERVNRCLCSYCGSALILRRITAGMVDEGRIEVFCPSCKRIEYGIEPEIYQAARYYVKTLRFDYYPDLDDSERKERMNVAKISEIIQWGLKNLGLLTVQGFNGVVQMDAALIGQDVLISEQEL